MKKMFVTLMLVVALLFPLVGCANFGKIDAPRETYAAVNDVFITTVQVLYANQAAFDAGEKAKIIETVVSIDKLLDAANVATKAGKENGSYLAEIRAALLALEPFVTKAKAQKKVSDGSGTHHQRDSYAAGHRGSVRESAYLGRGVVGSLHHPEGHAAASVGGGVGFERGGLGGEGVGAPGARDPGPGRERGVGLA